MSRRKRKPTAMPDSDPRDDLPNAPAMRLHLETRDAGQHRRGTQSAVRVEPGSLAWLERTKALTQTQAQAARTYQVWCDRMRPTPSPRGCVPTPRGKGSAPDEEVQERNARMWAEIRAVVVRQGRQPAAYLDALVWEGVPILAAHKLAALRVALDALAGFWRIGERR